jgi:hypothetical protein
MAARSSAKNFIRLAKSAKFAGAFEEAMALLKREYEDKISLGGAGNSAGDFLKDRLGLLCGDIADMVILEARKSLEMEVSAKAERSGKAAALHDYNTTLLFAAFKKFNFGYFVVSYWVGDGALALYNWNRRGKVMLLGQPDSGEFAGQTRFFNMESEKNLEKIKDRTQFVFADDFEAIIMMTDGVTDAFFESEASLKSEGEWRKFWTRTLKDGGVDQDPENVGCPEIFDKSAPLEAKASSLRRWLDFWSMGNHDDRTILIVKD